MKRISKSRIVLTGVKLGILQEELFYYVQYASSWRECGLLSPEEKKKVRLNDNYCAFWPQLIKKNSWYI